VREGRGLRAVFVNSGILGHAAVARLFREAMARDARIRARHIDLSASLSLRERLVRKLMCAHLPGSSTRFGRASYDLGRWRHELHAGLLARRRLREAEQREAFDVLHFHTQAVAYCSLRRLTRTPSIVSIDITQHLASLEVPPGLARRTYWPNIIHDGAVFRRAAAITAISRWAADDLAHHYPECAGRVHVMPYPVTLAAFDRAWIDERYARACSPLTANVASAPAEGGPPRRRTRVLFMGGDFPRKGGWELLRAWCAGGLSERAELVVATSWPVPPSMLPPGVTLARHVTPYSDAWLQLWRGTDLFVMPTKGEAFGMVFQEAAAAGVPAIGTRLNAIPEIIEHDVTGLLVPLGEELALVQAIDRLVRSADRRRELGEAARARIERVADPACYADKLTTLVWQVAGRRAV